MDDTGETVRPSDRQPAAVNIAGPGGIRAPTSNDANAHHQQRRPEDLEASQVEQECAVGITAYVTPDVLGFTCIFKQRYTDFLVNEIPPTGEVLHLREIGRPVDRKSRKERQGNNAADGQSDQVNGASDDAGVPSQTSPVEKRQADEAVEEGESVSKRPRLDIEPTPTSSASKATIDAEKSTPEVSEVDKSTLNSIFGQEKMTGILNLYEAVLRHPFRKARDHDTVKSDQIASKAARTEAHVAVRRIFASRLETATLQDEPGCMTVRAAPPRSATAPNQSAEHNGPIGKNGAQHKGKLAWDDLGGEYLHFTLYKENKDTMEVLFFLASELKVKVSTFQFAGTKDRRGVTVQRVAAFRIYKERVLGVTRLARGWKVGGFEYRTHGLELGELKGNEFVITLRDCRVPGLDGPTQLAKLDSVQAAVRKAADGLQESGFINYYGLQRFGSFRTGTHITGLKMLQGDLEGAIDGILSYDTSALPENVEKSPESRIPQEDTQRADAIRIWRQHKNAKKACARMPRRFQAENAIIQFLGRRQGGNNAGQHRDWQGALMSVQRGLRLMYVHAYQSFIWNQAAVKRREIHGAKVVEGDLVIVGEKDDGSRKKNDQVDQDGEVVVHPSSGEDAGPVEDAFVRARPLSKEEAQSGTWDIFDIVLPLPGWDVVYPQNEMGKFYEELMGSEEGGRLDPHQMRRAWKDASLAGGYRKMMARPLGGEVGVEAKSYSGEEQLVDTDVDQIAKGQEGTLQASEGDINGKAAEGDKVAVILRLQLGSSQYATMALRELTKGRAVAFKPDFSASR